MKFETKFNVGETVYFLSDNTLYKGVVNEIIINVRGGILEMYEVKFVNRDCEEATQDIGSDFLFKSTSDLFNKLMSDFKNANKENE